MKVFFQGEIVDQMEACIPLVADAYQSGYGVFETIKVHAWHISNVDAHLDRFFVNAEALFLEVPFTRDVIITYINDLIVCNTLVDAKMKIVLSQWIGVPLFALIPSLVDKYTPAVYRDGVCIITTQYQRALPHIKSLNYLPCVLALREAHNRGAFEGLLQDSQWYITEGSFSNLFFIKNAILYTAQDSILPGVTRSIVLDIAKNICDDVVLTTITKEMLYQADEIFLTSTLGEVIPVSRVDDVVLSVGEYTKKIAKAYREYIVGR